jgi:hypothetical protein
MSWLNTLLKQKQCLTRVLERDFKYIAQVRYAFFWFTLAFEEEQEYDYGNEYEENRNRLQKMRDLAAYYARTHKGYYLGTVEYESLRDKIRAKLRAKFTGPCGVQGARGDMGTPGAEGPRGRSYDDIQCPHCDTYRTDIRPSVPLHFDHFGEDTPLVYTCQFSKCGRQSNWIVYNGAFLHAGSITQHVVGDDAKPTVPDSKLP